MLRQERLRRGAAGGGVSVTETVGQWESERVREGQQEQQGWESGEGAARVRISVRVCLSCWWAQPIRLLCTTAIIIAII